MNSDVLDVLNESLNTYYENDLEDYITALNQIQYDIEYNSDTLIAGIQQLIEHYCNLSTPRCPHCGHELSNVYGYDNVRVLPHTVIKLQCEYCGNMFNMNQGGY